MNKSLETSYLDFTQQKSSLLDPSIISFDSPPPKCEKESPSDSRNVVYAIYFSYGVALMTPWNAVITCLPYY